MKNENYIPNESENSLVLRKASPIGFIVYLTLKIEAIAANLRPVQYPFDFINISDSYKKRTLEELEKLEELGIISRLNSEAPICRSDYFRLC